MKDSARIRTAVPGDADDLLGFWSVAAEGRSISDDASGVARFIERDADAVLLAERDGVLVGAAIAGFDGSHKPPQVPETSAGRLCFRRSALVAQWIEHVPSNLTLPRGPMGDQEREERL
ncbi:hypothetical protein ACWGCW_13015 [Streptomyces sp. NPDC054933]